MAHHTAPPTGDSRHPRVTPEDSTCPNCRTQLSPASSGVANLLGDRRTDRRCENGHWFSRQGRELFPGHPLVGDL